MSIRCNIKTATLLDAVLEEGKFEYARKKCDTKQEAITLVRLIEEIQVKLKEIADDGRKSFFTKSNEPLTVDDILQQKIKTLNDHQL